MPEARCLQETTLREAHRVASCNHEVIYHPNINERKSLLQRLGQQLISTRRVGNARRVVVSQQTVIKENEQKLREQLGGELRKARLVLGLTQADIAERVETDPETISRFERGATLPSLARLLDLAEALGVTIASLLGGASPRAVDELEELRHSLASLPAKDRRLAAAIIKTIVDSRTH